MTRTGYFLFNLLLVIVVYTLLYYTDVKDKNQALLYTLEHFSMPYIFVSFVMAIYSLLRSLMTHNHDVGADGAMFLHGVWFSCLLTFIAYEIISAGGFLGLYTHLKHLVKL